jgi:hypothetical protein
MILRVAMPMATELPRFLAAVTCVMGFVFVVFGIAEFGPKHNLLPKFEKQASCSMRPDYREVSVS